MKTVIRHDRASLRRPEMTPQGFMRADGHFARAGIYEYRRADGSVQRELRPIEEVHHPESLKSYADAPVTMDHPADGEVTAENVKKYEVGSVRGDALPDGEHVAGGIIVKDASAIKKVKGGQQELSPGYRITLDESPGADRRYGYPGNELGRYDAIQRNIRVNHLAIVPRARGGSTIRLRMDGYEVMHRDSAPRYAVGDRIEATADHMPGMAGQLGTIEIANEGTPPYYAVRFDAQNVFPGVHKWLSEDEVRAQAARTDAALNAKERHALSASDFAVPDGEGLPINDAEHVRAAMARFGQFEFKDAAQKKAAYGRIIRRAKALEVDSSGFSDKWADRLDGKARLTTVVDGHQHSIDLEPCYGSRMSGCTSWSVSDNEKAENGHSHDWVRNVDGTVTIGMAEGHTHALLDENPLLQAALNPTPAPRNVTQLDQPGAGSEIYHMDKDEQIRSLREQLAAAEAKLGPQSESATKATARADAAEATVSTLRGEITELRSQIAAAATVVETDAIRREKTRADAAEQDLARQKDGMEAAIQARVELERKASVVMPELKMRGLSDRQIMATVVKRLDAAADVGAGISDGYLQGKFDSLLESHARNARAHQTIGQVIHSQAQQREDAFEQTMEEKRRAWRNRGNEPLPNSREAQQNRGRV